MNKYLIFRSMSEIRSDDDKFDEDAETELVAVEYGHNYYEAIEDIVAAINADLAGLPESEYAEVCCRRRTLSKSNTLVPSLALFPLLVPQPIS